MRFSASHGAAFLAALVLALGATNAQAQRILYQGSAGQVTDADVNADAAVRFSDAARDTLLSRPANVRQIAANVYVQRAMAAQATQQGLAQGAHAEAILRLAREKALADLYWEKFDQTHQPSEQALQDYAQATYNAMGDKDLQAPERARVSHVLLKDKSPQGREKIEGWLRQLQAGADFARFAREHSEDPGSVGKGGDLGFVSEGMVVAPFEQAVQALKHPGDLSGIVETEFGLHIIRLTERRAAGKRGFDELRDQLMLNARATLMKEAHAREIRRLQEDGAPNDKAIDAYAAQFTPAEGAAPAR